VRLFIFLLVLHVVEWIAVFSHRWITSLDP
jgi:hypothetical protein